MAWRAFSLRSESRVTPLRRSDAILPSRSDKVCWRAIAASSSDSNRSTAGSFPSKSAPSGPSACSSASRVCWKPAICLSNKVFSCSTVSALLWLVLLAEFSNSSNCFCRSEILPSASLTASSSLEDTDARGLVVPPAPFFPESNVESTASSKESCTPAASCFAPVASGTAEPIKVDRELTVFAPEFSSAERVWRWLLSRSRAA